MLIDINERKLAWIDLKISEKPLLALIKALQGAKIFAGNTTIRMIKLVNNGQEMNRGK